MSTDSQGLGAQLYLSEELRFLHEMGFSGAPMRNQFSLVHSNKEIDADLRILDVVALCLTSGKPGDVVAATLHKQENVTLVLAKHGAVSPADYMATHEFLAALRKARSWKSLLPFLAKHSKETLNKRIRNMHQSVADLSDDLKAAAADVDIPLESLEIEFPHAGRYSKAKHPDSKERTASSFLGRFVDGFEEAYYSRKAEHPEDPEHPTAERFLDELINECIAASTTFEVQENEASHGRYIRLSNAAYVLWRSRLLDCLAKGDHQHGRWMLRKRAGKLQRRLGKICQYGRLDKVIRLVKRSPNVPFRWVEDDFAGSCRTALCTDPMEVAERVSGKRFSSQEIDVMTQHFPELWRNWERQRSTDSCVHAEMRIIFHLSPALLSGPQPPIGKEPRLSIGCSKKPCICCSSWIDSFNTLAISSLSWLTSSSFGNSYVNWAIPRVAGEMEHVGARCNTSVILDVGELLDVRLERLFIRGPVSTDDSESDVSSEDIEEADS